jgi:prepilin peptidase CpaA
MQPAILFVAVGILAVIAYGDVRVRRIPNALSLAIAALGLARIAFAGDSVAASATLAAAAATFTVTFLLFWRGVIGGGDAKLVAAVALLVGQKELLSFLFLMSLCGGALAAATFARDQLRPQCWRLSGRGRRPVLTEADGSISAPVGSTVPYGVAIAAAGVITLVIESSFAR